jgi:hypothetical protein
MFLSILIALGICLAGVALTWIGIELTLRPPQDESEKGRARIFLGVSALVLLGLTVLATVRAERASDRSTKEIRDLPNRIAEYIRNTTPPPGLPNAVRAAQVALPSPPTGLIVAEDGDWGARALQMGGQIFDFLSNQGEVPVRGPSETDVNYIVRSNAWYSDVMTQYRKQFGPQVITLVGLLVKDGLLEKPVGDLAKNPVNLIGIRALADQLMTGGRNFRKKHPPK